MGAAVKVNVDRSGQSNVTPEEMQTLVPCAPSVLRRGEGLESLAWWPIVCGQKVHCHSVFLEMPKNQPCKQQLSPQPMNNIFVSSKAQLVSSD